MGRFLYFSVQRTRVSPLMALFRVVRNADNQELRRYLALEAVCVHWVKDSRNLRVEELPTGTATRIRKVGVEECCAILRRWLPANENFVSEKERNDIERLIHQASRQRLASYFATVKRRLVLSLRRMRMGRTPACVQRRRSLLGERKEAESLLRRLKHLMTSLFPSRSDCHASTKGQWLRRVRGA